MLSTKKQYVDSHAHLTSPQFLEIERDEVIKRAVTSGIHTILNISTKHNELVEAFQLTPKDLNLLHAASTTPHDASQNDAFFSFVEEQALSKKLAAVGETGLDYYYENSPKTDQRLCLERYLDLSIRANLPVVIHCRDAFTDFISILDQFQGKVRGVLHCFTGTLQDAKALLDRGFYISFSGIVTYPKSHELREVLKCIPLERLLLETDAPYLAPQGFRGKRCEPAMITTTYTIVSEFLSVEPEVVMTAVNKAFRGFLTGL